jgi:hypothetical protein
MRNNQIIAYIPPEEVGATSQSFLWKYRNLWGKELDATLALSILAQVVVAVLLAVKAFKQLPILSNFDSMGETWWSWIGTAIAVIASLIINALLVTELAPVIWLTPSEKLKIRLSKESIWWWLILIVTIAMTLLNFFAIFLALTNTSKVEDAWVIATSNQLVGFVTISACLFYVLTLWRCASVMNTASMEQIRQMVQEKIEADSSEILLDASDFTKRQAREVFENGQLDPKKFIALNEVVLAAILRQYPGLFPQGWEHKRLGYDFSSNTFAALPSPTYQALKRAKVSAEQGAHPKKSKDPLWAIPNDQLYREINRRMKLHGVPNFIDVEEPDAPAYYYTPIPRGQEKTKISQKSTAPAETGQFYTLDINRLKPGEKFSFKLFLTDFVKSQGEEVKGDVFRYFSQPQLEELYVNWKKIVTTQQG